MSVVISIIAIIAAITLYDYFTARKWQQVTSTVRNSLVFEHRNQEYGAYVLRRDYNKNLAWIMLGLILTIGVIYGSYVIVKSMPEEVIPPPPIDKSQFLVAAPPIEKDLPPPPPKQELPPPMEKTVAFLPPVVVDIPVEDEVVIVDPEVKVGKEEIKGDDVVWDVVTNEKEPEKTEVKAPTVYTFVDEEAFFPGGYGAMTAFIQKKLVYPQTASDNGIQGTVYVQFIVSADGSISNATVQRGIPGCPECDREAVRVVKSMPDWKPGKINGNSVSQYYSLPITLALE